MTTRLLSKLLYGVNGSDPFTLVPVSLALLGASALASFQPAIKAASLDPMQALRTE
jgi:ABC-type lipoprotein release transport system permease subunit